MMGSKYSRGALTPLATFLFAAACGQTSHSQSASTATAGQPADDAVVATVGEREITLAEVDEKLLASNREVFQALYDARRNALSTLVAESLLDAEAARRGLTRDELVAEEVDSKIAPVADADVEAFYQQNEARLGGQTLEQVGGQIREFLEVRMQQTQRQSYIDSLRDGVEVAIALDPPRVPIQVADGERVRGAEDADVTIVEYSDFQ